MEVLSGQQGRDYHFCVREEAAFSIDHLRAVDTPSCLLQSTSTICGFCVSSLDVGVSSGYLSVVLFWVGWVEGSWCVSADSMNEWSIR